MTTRSIRFRLVFWYAGLLIAAFVLLGSLILFGLRAYLVRNLGQTQIQRARQMAETLLANVDKTGETHVVEEINSWVTPEVNNRFVRITRGDSSVLFVSRDPRDMSFVARQVPIWPQPVKEISWRTQILPDGRGLVIAAVPCQSGSGRHFLVEVGVPLKSAQDILQRFVILLVSGLAVMVVVAIAGGYWLVGKALAPVDQISSSAERISLHNLSDRLPIAKTGDELERLSVSLNNMIVRLEDAVRHNQRFIADASHELRTPLTLINGELESLVQDGELSMKTEQTLSSVLEEVERLRRIVEGLFSISRLDSGEAEKKWMRFDLSELASTTVEQIRPLAEDIGVELLSTIPSPAPVDGDRARFKQVLVNLLDNAIKYTPSGGKVHLSVKTSEGRAMLEVADTGIGIPLEAQPRIFERFFRVDEARSRDLGGAGLGLSIVKSICSAYGGKVEVESAEGKGSRFRIEFPLARSETNPNLSKNGN
jgi:heavy metal sensor kinase